MSLRFHEIAEAHHRIQNPFTHEKLMLLGEVCRLSSGPHATVNIKSGMTQLDLACGKAEMLCQWAREWGVRGVGADISPVFIAAARRRIEELGVSHLVTVVEAEAAEYAREAGRFDIVSCIGATWIGGGLAGTLELMRANLNPGGLLLVGEPFWHEPPTEEVLAAMNMGQDDYTSLAGTLERLEAAGFELVEMVLADHDSWDRYEAMQWWAAHEWLRTHPDHTDAATIRGWNQQNRRTYLAYGRRYLGWGVFVLRVQG